MSFKLLYELRQTLPDYVNRNVIKDGILGITGIPKISVAISDLDLAVCRGIYISPKNKEHPFAHQFGHHVVVVGRGLNRCWQRFVAIKEMMHAFADPDSAVDGGEAFENLLEEFSNPSSQISPQMLSELDCFWMALAAICREDQRLEFAKSRAANEISDYDIALKLKLPEAYVPRLFEPRYSRIIEKLTA